MSTPAWIPDTLAAVMFVVATVSAARLAAAAHAGRWRLGLDADVDGAHLLMAIAMAGMLVVSLRTLPDGAWLVVFALMSAWFIVRVAREERGRGLRGWVSGCHAPHLVHSLAMSYMFAAVAPGGGAAGMGAAGEHAPTLALVLALALAGYTVRDLDRLTDPVGAGFYPRVPVLAATAGPAPGVPGPAAAAAFTAGVEAAPYGGNETDPRHDVAAPEADRIRAAVLTPRVATICRIAMGVTMAYMLVIMI